MSNNETLNIEARRRLVLERYLDGATMRQIARELDVSVGTVHSDIRFCREQWREEMNHSLEVWKDLELERIDRVEAAAWEGWERSLRDQLKTSTEKNRGNSPTENGINRSQDKAKVEKTNRDGDASFLKILATCIDQRCKILGLYAPKKTDVTSGGSPIKFIAGVNEELV